MMEFTGERVVPGQTDPDLMNEHLARYCFAEALAGQKRVLDAGCGLGYGSARLARRTQDVFALDNAFEPLLQASTQYEPEGVRFAQGDVTSLPFRSESFDVVVAFEVIEHLENWQGFLAEMERVLAPAGQLIVSTPNRLYYAETRSEPNLYHVHEFDYQEFQSERQKFFPHVTIFLGESQQRHHLHATDCPRRQDHPGIELGQAGGGALFPCRLFEAAAVWFSRVCVPARFRQRLAGP